MDEDKNVILGYSAGSNISFRGTWDTGIPKSEWDEMSGRDRDEVFMEALNDLVDMYVMDAEEEVW